jgi:hypothetical protein
MLRELNQAEPFLGPSLRWHWVWNQGEAEAKLASDEMAKRWLADFKTLKAALEKRLGTKLRPVVVRTHFAMARGRHVSVVRSAQAEAGVTVCQDDLPLADGTHLSGASQNILGERIAAALLGP